MTRLMRVLACYWLSMSVLLAGLLAGCGEDRADKYFRELEKPAENGAVEVDSGATTQAPDNKEPEPLADSKPVEIDEVPPPKLVGTREVKESYEDGSARVVRQVKLYTDDNTVNHGDYVEWHPNGKRFCEGTYADSRRTGEWTFWFANGKKAKTGSYRNGRPEGNWTYWRPDGTVDRKEGYKDSKRDGPWIYYNKEGKPRRQAEYKSGKKHGTWIRWHDNGQKSAEGHYVDDQLHGVQSAWYKNGQMANRAAFVHGKRHGKIISWNELGDKTTELLYENDVLVKRLFPSGKL